MSSLRGGTTARATFSPKQRLALAHNTGVSTSAILNMPDADITYQFLLDHSVPSHNLAAAGVGPVALKARGASDASDLVALGHDALHLCDPVFCDGAIAAFGAASVVEAFLRAPLDAVSLAGSAAVERLGLSQQRLLEVCAGASVEAFAVLKSDSRPDGLRTRTLLDTGLRGRQLAEVGLTAESPLLGTPAETKKLFC